MAHQSSRSLEAPLLPHLGPDLGDFSAAIPLELLSSAREVSLNVHEEISASNDLPRNIDNWDGADSIEPQISTHKSQILRQPSIALSTSSTIPRRQPFFSFANALAKARTLAHSTNVIVERRIRQSRFHGWRMGVLVGCCMSTFVLCCNIAVIIASMYIRPGYFPQGIVNLVTGDEASVSRWNTTLHVLINAFSTMLLGGSNYTMQVLSSPTRFDIDRAHAKGQWVEIGLLSSRNLKAIPRKRVFLWLVLGLSSIPLHLFYNASVFKVVTDSPYDIFIVDINSPEYRRLNGSADTSTSTGTYRNLSNSQWSDMYNRQFVSVNGDLHLAIDRVAFSTSAQLSNVTISNHLNSSKPGDQQRIQLMISESTNWVDWSHTFKTVDASTNQSSDASISSVHVLHAFAQKKTGPSTASRVQLSLYFIAVVISCNVLKLGIMLWVLIADKSSYIVTLGDAVASFLEHPDTTTEGESTLGKEEITFKLGYMPYHLPEGEQLDKPLLRVRGIWLPRSPRYFASLGRGRQSFFAILFCVVISANLLVPIFANSVNSEKMRAWGSASDIILPFKTGTLFNAWVVNSPQLLLSFCYFALNSICTSIAGMEEWNNLARYRKTLRVTQPRGEQRSTYFLQLPYRWATPLIIMSGALHWLLSQTFFVVRLDSIDRDGEVTVSTLSACGYSPLSLVVFLGTTLILLCVIGWIGLRRMQQKIPFAASCSLAISAACHPPNSEKDPHLAALRWGVVEQKVAEEHKHCTFSSQPVKRPDVGKLYY